MTIVGLLRADAWKYCVLIAYACWVLVIGAHHEPWFDEAQAWLLARDNGLVDLLVHRVRYEGSPGLWHALLWFLIRAGLPYSSLYLVSAAFAIAGAAVVLWRAPFPPIVRILVLGSYFYGFQYSVVARSYAFDLLLIPLLAACFETRRGHPVRYAMLIGLLANANTHSFLLAGVLGLEFALTLTKARFWNDRSATIALLLATGLGLLALATAWQPTDNAYLTPNTGSALVRVLNYIRDGFIDSSHPFSSTYLEADDKSVGSVLSMAVIILTAVLLGSSSALPVFAMMFVALTTFSASIYSSPWHSGFLTLGWIFALWIGWSKLSPNRSRDAAIMISAVLGIQTVQAGVTGIWDYRNDFSAAPRVAAMVIHWRAAHPTGRIVAIGYKPFELQPYFSANIFSNYHDGRPKPAYMSWSKYESYRIYGRQVEIFQDALKKKGDLVVTPIGSLTPTMLNEWFDLAHHYGYRPIRLFRSNQLWRGHRIENESESILTFERRP